MPKTVPAIDLDTLQDLHQHPAVAPLWAERAALLARQESAQAEIDAARSIMRLGESDDPVRFRKTRRQAEQAEEEWSDARLALVDLSERIDAAKSTARLELRPLIEQAVIPVLEQAERAMLELSAVQETLLALDKRMRRLGVGPALSRFVDGTLAGRLQALRHTLAKIAG